MQLRPYQVQAVETITKATTNTLIQAPCGAGKTIIMSHAIHQLEAMSKRCLILAHRGELIRQAEDKLKAAVDIDCHVYSAYLKRKELGGVTVASIQSLARCKEIPHFDFVFIDECHRLPPPDKKSQYKKVLDLLGTLIIGVTATPYRSSGGFIYGKGQWFGKVNYQIEMRLLIDQGHLCEYRHKLSNGAKMLRADMGGVKKCAGEYNQKEMGEVVTKEIHLETVMHALRDYGQARSSVVVFCVNIKHAELLLEKLDEAGESACMVHSQLPTWERDENLAAFDDGEVRWMLNIGILTEGWDCTRVDCIVLARPTLSTALYVQMVGRGLRVHDKKKDCLILDVVGNYLSHGLVESPNVKSGGRESEKNEHRICEFCLEVIKNIDLCPVCGEEKTKEEKKVIRYASARHGFQDVDEGRDMVFLGGSASFYTAKNGGKCIKVELRATGGIKAAHYYRVDMKWIGTKFAAIVNTYYSRNVGNWLAPSRFMAAINGGHIFPLQAKAKREKYGWKVKGF